MGRILRMDQAEIPILPNVRSTAIFLTQFHAGQTMPSLPQAIMEHAGELPEGGLLCPNALLHLGSRAAVDQALSRLARSGRLIRICQGVYTLPVETSFGTRSPSVENVIAALSSLWGEPITPSGGAAANALGLTTQVPVRPVYLTSGPNRNLKLGGITIELQHAPKWQLVAPKGAAGHTVRALAWLGPEEVEDGLRMLRGQLTDEDIGELAEARAMMPGWIAGPVSNLVANG